jgi:hypothetical protein
MVMAFSFRAKAGDQEKNWPLYFLAGQGQSMASKLLFKGYFWIVI